MDLNDLTTKILQGIREDIQGLRKDMNERFVKVDERFAAVHAELGGLRHSINAIVSFKERDTILMANELDGVRRRLATCEERLGIVPT